MDIHLVRRKFQRTGNIFVDTDANIDLSHVPYSLQQESLNSINMFLYITTAVDLALEGHVLTIKNQKWIVQESMKETVNTQLFEYKLYPVTDLINVRLLDIRTNALGLIDKTGASIEHLVHCFVDDRGLKERAVPSAQPVEAIQQIFYVARYEMPDVSSPYEVYYQGNKYKVDSLEKISGAIKLRLTEDK
jgi:hypothetical protein